MPEAILLPTYSTLPAASLAPIIKECYGFPDVHVELFMRAFGDIYDVQTTNERFVLRVYHTAPDMYDSICSEAEFLDHLHRSGLSVAHPRCRLDGDWPLALGAIEGQRYALLFTFAEGKPISATTDLKAILRYGELVARLHQAADNFPGQLDRSPITFQGLVDDGIERLIQLRPQYTDAIAYFREIADLLRPQLADWPTDKPYYGMCHGDISPSNVHIAPDGTPTLYDFQLAGPCWRIYDVASFISTVAYKKLPATFTTAFLEGYEKIRPLASFEYRAIPLIRILRKYITLSVFTNFVEPFGSYTLSEEFVRDTVDQIKSIVPELSQLGSQK